MNANKEIVRRFIRAINEHAWPSLDGLVHPHFIRHQVGSPAALTSRGALVDFLDGELRTFPDAHEEIRELIADGDRVAAYLTFTGTQLGPLGDLPARGRRLTAEFACLFRIESGMIAEAWVVWDGLDMLRQLGHFGPNASG